jgi:flagellar biosynthesis/type III secretory pathway protein FliH
MAKVYKKNGDDGRREVVPYERDVLETPLDVLAELGDAGSLPVDPSAMREQVLADTLGAAREEAERKVREAYEEGRRRGFEEGRLEFEASVAQCARALETAAAEIRAAHARFMDSLEPEVFELAGLVAARILDREARTDPDHVHRVVRRAIGCIADQARLTVRVHPDDLAALKTHKVTLLEEFAGVEHLEVVADDNVSPGGCTVDSARMHVDSRLETLLANILDELAD